MDKLITKQELTNEFAVIYDLIDNIQDNITKFYSYFYKNNNRENKNNSSIAIVSIIKLRGAINKMVKETSKMTEVIEGIENVEELMDMKIKIGMIKSLVNDY